MAENRFAKFTHKREPSIGQKAGRLAGSAVTGLARGAAVAQDLPFEAANFALRQSHAISGAEGEALQIPFSPQRERLEGATGPGKILTEPRSTPERFIANTAEAGVSMLAPGGPPSAASRVAKAVNQGRKGTAKAIQKEIEIALTPQARNALGRFMTKTESHTLAQTKSGSALARIFKGAGAFGRNNVARRIDAAAIISQVPSFTTRFAAAKFNLAGGKVVTRYPDQAVASVFSRLGLAGRLGQEAYDSFGGAGYFAYEATVAPLLGLPPGVGIAAAIQGKAVGAVLTRVAKNVREPDALIAAMRDSKFVDQLKASRDAGLDTFKAAVVLLAMEPEFQNDLFGEKTAEKLRAIPAPKPNRFRSFARPRTQGDTNAP